MKSVTVEITGTTAILMHADNIEWADEMELWRNDPKNKNKSKAGDDRTPPWRWIGCLYHDGESITIPTENISRCLMEAAAQVQTGKGKKTFKSQSQSGLLIPEFNWKLRVNNRTIAKEDILALKDDQFTFAEQMQAVKDLGFLLFVKRARIGNNKHIRVRPRFDSWSAMGEIQIFDEEISKNTLQVIFDIAGRTKGLGDWRPGSKTPGPWGMFKAKVI